MKKTGIEKNEKRLLKKSTLVEGEVIENSFCRLSPINASSDASIVDSSIERKVTLMVWVRSVLRVNPTTLVPIGGIGEESLRLYLQVTSYPPLLL